MGKTASEYLQYAIEGRQLAGQERATEARTYLLEMVELWTVLANKSAPFEQERSEQMSGLASGANDSRAREPSQ